jgi:quercetin dioxygenase-like cupin family protein
MNDSNSNKNRTRVALLLALTLAVCVSASATPGSGVTKSDTSISGNLNINLVKSDANNLLLLQFPNDNAPINIVNQDVTIAPGGYTGWHSHGGPGIVVVVQGTLSEEKTLGCFEDYPQGSWLFEAGPSEIHNVVNRTGSPVIFHATIFLPAFVPPGGNARIDQPVQYGPCGR